MALAAFTSNIERNGRDDNVYYTISITNSGDHGDIPASFVEDRQIPIINNPNEYFVSCVNFNIPCYTIPIFTFKVQPNQPNPNLGIYSVTVSDISTDTFNQRYVLWQPTNYNATVPLGPEFLPYGQQQLNSYYMCYEYQHFIDLINIAIATAHGDAGFTGSPPYFIYDAATSLISLIAPIATYSVANGGLYTLSCNEVLYKYFAGIETVYNGVSQPNNSDYTFLVKPNHNNYYSTPGVSTPDFAWYQMRQETIGLPLWEGFTSLTMVTLTVPVQFENIAQPALGLSNYIPSSCAGQANTSNILMNYIAIWDTPQLSPRTMLTYTRSDNYRITNLQQSTPLLKFDIAIYWVDNLGNQYPLMIGPRQSLSIKFVFVKKDLYRH
jgi:hypothetical protein